MDFFNKFLNKDFWKLDFLNLTFFKILFMVIIALLILIYAPWFVQYVLNFLFLITSFVVFMIIYIIVDIIRQLKGK